ncbi:Protein YidD [Candidatus Paraburkholderia kirkii UZHbot1]|uniref:Putative membrane protein insertion efficiency factor n=1 Tax=Candidatus Paraburkholderia kirkii UZHbot1 TaxID=1055526 RepID=G4MIT6_9BURK|nr:Protein YidD [Candidatus Paraburkholderia kirkii UZHbot1]
MKRRMRQVWSVATNPACGAKLMQTALIALLRFYKLVVSPLLGNRCRFYPSCSDYAREAIQYHGAAHGTYLAVKRLCRCHPLSAGGVDLVPPPPRQPAIPTSPHRRSDSASSDPSARDKLSTLNGAEALSDRH